MMLRPLLASALALALWASATDAPAQSIGLHFSGGRLTGTAYDLAPSDTAGVVPQANWNNVLNPSQTPGDSNTTNVTGPMPGVVVNSSGAATPVTFTVTSTNTWDVYNSSQTGDRQLLNGYLDNTNAATPTTVTVNNIPFTSPYTVYAYVGSDGNNRSGHATLGSQTNYYLTSDNPFNGYVQATATDLASAAPANYIRFDNVTGNTFTLTNTRDSNNVGLHAIQIVPVPEPGHILLGCAGVFGFLRAWRRRPSRN